MEAYDVPTHQCKWHARSLVEVLVADVAWGETCGTRSVALSGSRCSHGENPLHESVNVLTKSLSCRTIRSHGDIDDLLGRGVPSEDMAESGVQSPNPSATAAPVEVKVAASRAIGNVRAAVAPITGWGVFVGHFSQNSETGEKRTYGRPFMR